MPESGITIGKILLTGYPLGTKGPDIALLEVASFPPPVTESNSLVIPDNYADHQWIRVITRWDITQLPIGFGTPTHVNYAFIPKNAGASNPFASMTVQQVLAVTDVETDQKTIPSIPSEYTSDLRAVEHFLLRDIGDDGQYMWLAVWIDDGTGNISGHITESSGHTGLVGATIEAKQDGVTIGTATSSSGGAYSINGVVDGRYDMVVSAPSYTDATGDQVVVQFGVNMTNPYDKELVHV